MKNLKLLPVLLLLPAVIFTSCSDLFNVTDDFVFTDQIVVASTTVNSYSVNKSIDLTTNQKFNDNKERIKDVSIEKIEFRIENRGASAQTVSGFLLSETSGGTLHNENQQTVALSTYSDWTDITPVQATLDKLENLAKNSPHTLTVNASGSTDPGFPDFTIHIRITGKVTASAI